jgi:hypothetical protein
MDWRVKPGDDGRMQQPFAVAFLAQYADKARA